jgi:hypothetical protein
MFTRREFVASKPTKDASTRLVGLVVMVLADALGFFVAVVVGVNISNGYVNLIATLRCLSKGTSHLGVVKSLIES